MTKQPKFLSKKTYTLPSINPKKIITRISINYLIFEEQTIDKTDLKCTKIKSLHAIVRGIYSIIHHKLMKQIINSTMHQTQHKKCHRTPQKSHTLKSDGGRIAWAATRRE